MKNSVPFANIGGGDSGRTGIQIDNFADALGNGEIVGVFALHGLQGVGVVVFGGVVVHFDLLGRSLLALTRAVLFLALRFVRLFFLLLARFFL